MISDVPLDYNSLSLLNDSLLCTDSVHSYSFGVSGEPVPDLLSTDSTMNLMMLGCLVFLIVALTRSREFYIRQLSGFFYVAHAEELGHRTTQENLLQLAIIVTGCLSLAVATFIPALTILDPDAYFPDKPTAILLFALFFLLFFLSKVSIQYVVNMVFFGKRRATFFIQVQMLITACSSMLVFPIAFLVVYLPISTEISALGLVFVLVLNKILAFYKIWNIFFRQNGLFLQIILYFCTLEIAPLAAAGGIWLSIFNGLK